MFILYTKINQNDSSNIQKLLQIQTHIVQLIKLI